MANNKLQTNGELLVYTNNDELWVFVEQYLDFLGYIGIKSDIEFMRLYNELTNYVQTKLRLPKNGGAIVDMYHVICQECIKN